jgi:hypothetical protein
VRRTAKWGWAEPEWRVSVRKEGAAGASRIERTPPAATADDPLPSGIGLASSGRTLFAKIREGSISEKSPPVPMAASTSMDGANDGAGAGSSGGHARSRSVDINRARPPSEERKSDHGHGDGHVKMDEEPMTDADGWIYGDNKWEAQSARGGMGKVSVLISGLCIVYRTDYQHSTPAIAGGPVLQC